MALKRTRVQKEHDFSRMQKVYATGFILGRFESQFRFQTINENSKSNPH